MGRPPDHHHAPRALVGQVDTWLFPRHVGVLSALFTAGRYDELIELGQSDVLWSYKRWAVKALAAQGRSAEAIAYAGRCRSPWANDRDIDSLCERILLASGRPASFWRTSFVTRPVRRASGSPPRRMRSCSTRRSLSPTRRRAIRRR